MLKQFSDKLKKYPKIFVLTLILIFLVPFLLIDILGGSEGRHSRSKNYPVGEIRGEIINSQKYIELYKKAWVVTIVQRGDMRVFNDPENRLMKEFILRKAYALKVTGISQLAQSISREKYIEKVEKTAFFNSLKAIGKNDLDFWKDRLKMTNKEINTAFKEQALLEALLTEFSIDVDEKEIVDAYKKRNTKIDMGFRVFRIKDYRSEYLHNKFDKLGLAVEFDESVVLDSLYGKQVKKMFNNNPREYDIAAKISLKKINFDYKKIANIVRISDKEVRTFYDSRNDYKQEQYQYLTFFPIAKLEENNKNQFDARAQNFYKKYQKGLTKKELDKEIKKYSEEYKISVLFEKKWQAANSLNHEILNHLKLLKSEKLKFFSLGSTRYGLALLKKRNFIPFEDVKEKISKYLKESKALRLAEQKSDELYEKLSQLSMKEIQKVVAVKSAYYTVEQMPSFNKTSEMANQIAFNLKISPDKSFDLDIKKPVSRSVSLPENQIALLIVSNYIPEKKQTLEQAKTQIYTKLVFDDVQKYIKEKVVSEVKRLQKNYDGLIKNKVFYTKEYQSLVLPIYQLLSELKNIEEDKAIALPSNTEGIRIYVFRAKEEPNLKLEKTQFDEFKTSYVNSKRDQNFVETQLSKIKEELKIY